MKHKKEKQEIEEKTRRIIPNLEKQGYLQEKEEYPLPLKIFLGFIIISTLIMLIMGYVFLNKVDDGKFQPEISLNSTNICPTLPPCPSIPNIPSCPICPNYTFPENLTVNCKNLS